MRPDRLQLVEGQIRIGQKVIGAATLTVLVQFDTLLASLIRRDIQGLQLVTQGAMPVS